MAFSEDESTWDAFLAEWPLERLRSMSLPEYTQAGDKHCFTYWMEAGLDEYGSIWGGSAFKFGIYSRNDRNPRASAGGAAWDDDYGWYSRFGDTRDAAFAVVRDEVVRIAEAARAGRWSEIDSSELGPAYRWKIAFHYQDRSLAAQIPCVFLRKPLLHACGLSRYDRSTAPSALYEQIAGRRAPGMSLMAFSRELWRDWVMATPLVVKLTEGAVKNGYIPVNMVSAPFPETARGGADEAEAGEALPFRTDTGWSFQSDVRAPTSDSGRIRTRMGRYFQQNGVQPGDELEIRPDEGGVYHITHRPRGGTAPQAAAAAPLQPSRIAESNPERPAMPQPTNRILFGPPGTGKTYHTVNETLALLDPDFLDDHADDRAALKTRFDALADAGRVRFVTFHQSFSYEDFVEGIRASTDEDTGALRYEVEDGVFKQLCEAARSRTVVDAYTDAPIDLAGRRIWKVSLGDAGTEGHVFEECMDQGIALLGFGYGADLAGVTSRQEILQRIQAADCKIESDAYAVTALDLFVRRMKVGDLVVVTHGNLKFRAIGEVTGEYFRKPAEAGEHYVQARPVRWLRQYDPPRPYPDLMENRFSQMTIYELRPGSINLDRLARLLAPEQATIHGDYGVPVSEPESRVLVIDEINRGNVSRIFGELITLIEPSKRQGCAEALEVTLPYSKQRFGVPANLHIIGTMNTADRSLAGLDVALRRRFEFVEMLPDPAALAGIVVEGVAMDKLLATINRRIEILLGRDFMLGHANFMALRGEPTLDGLAGVFRRQVLPLLQEYFFEDWQKIAWVLNDHRKPQALRFLQQADSGLAELLGPDVELPRDRHLWRINAAAFTSAQAYRAIIDAADAGT